MCKESSEREDDNEASKLHCQDKNARDKDLEEAMYMYARLGATFSSRGEFRKAIDYFNQYLTIAKELGSKEEEGIAYNSLGIAFNKLGDFRKAIHYHNQHLRIAKEVGDKSQEGSAYCNLGLAFLGLSDFKKAEEYHNLDLTNAKEMRDKAAEGRAYGNLGNTFYGLGKFREGIEYHNLRLCIAKELANKSWEGETYGDLGIGFFNLGDLKKVIQYYNRHLSISRDVGDKDMEGRACGNLGNAFHHLGDLKQSIKYYNLRLGIAIELGNKYEEGRAYGSLGSAFYKLGDFKNAIGNFFLCLSIAEDAGNKVLKGRMCCNLGNAFSSLGDYIKAKEFHDVDLNISKGVGDRAGEGRACCNLANVFYHLGDFKKAVQYNKLHLTIAKEMGDKTGEGRAYNNLGTAYQRIGAFEKAVEYHNLALGIAEEVGEKAAEGRANSNLGSAFQSRGEYHNAISYYNRYLRIAKDVGDKKMEGDAYYALGNSYELQSLISEALEHYQSSVRLFNDVRSLLQSKDEWKIGFRNEQHLAYNGLWRTLLKEERNVEALFAAEEGRAQALTDLMKFQYGVRANQSGSHGQQMKDSDMLNCIPSNVVFQALDRSTITSWVLVEGRVVGFKRNELERDAAGFFRSSIQRTYNSIGVRAGVSCENRSLDALREDAYPVERSHEEISPPSTPQGGSLSTLYDIVIKPIANLIQGNELIIVPDGPLWLAPYAAFMDTDSKYLCESFRIRLIPSLNSLKMIADCPHDYHRRSGALLVGNPWVKEVTDSKGKQLLEDLPSAKQEVEMIGEIFKVTPLTGKEATKAAVLKRLSSVALVHIAAHGRMETGEIALTPDPERTSLIPTEDDYVLTMKDVLSVQLRARLVVLSCCHSGRGEIKAEGVVGIARAFMGAGARAVLVSLWAIDDEATLEFMRSFYHHLVEGSSASESLNQAMKDLRESDKYSDMKYWAPFVLIGDDVTLEVAAKN